MRSELTSETNRSSSAPSSPLWGVLKIAAFQHECRMTSLLGSWMVRIAKDAVKGCLPSPLKKRNDFVFSFFSLFDAAIANVRLSNSLSLARSQPVSLFLSYRRALAWAREHSCAPRTAAAGPRPQRPGSPRAASGPSRAGWASSPPPPPSKTLLHLSFRRSLFCCARKMPSSPR